MKPLIVGIIGPSGSGKSTLRALFAQAGAFTIDGDALARKVVEPGQPCLLELIAEFGADLVRADGTLDRTLLAQRAFSDAERTDVLNRITHRYILEEMRMLIEQSAARVVAIDAAALMESGAGDWCDVIICVTASKQTRLARIMKRDGLTQAAALQRMQAQKDDAFYRSAATDVLQSDEEAAFLKQASALVARYTQGV